MALFPLGLLSQGGGGPAGAFEQIETQLIGGTSPTSVTFSSIPSTYKHLQLRVVSRWNAGGASNLVQVRFNGDTASNYYYHDLTANGSNLTSGQSNLATFMQTGDAPSSGVVADAFGVQIIDLLDYSNTNKNKTLRSAFGQHNASQAHSGIRSGIWFSNSAITSITVFGNQGGSFFVSGSRLSLYGIKG
jgi:hypothetical protein